MPENKCNRSVVGNGNNLVACSPGNLLAGACGPSSEKEKKLHTPFATQAAVSAICKKSLDPMASSWMEPARLEGV